MINIVLERAQGRIQRTLAESFFCRRIQMRNSRPVISFTFDDFPHSALAVGGHILRCRDLRGTYYASFGLMDMVTPTGRIFGREDLDRLVADGHEVGSHTFSHSNSWSSSAPVFAESVKKNSAALATLIPGSNFVSFSYPITVPRPSAKRIAASAFQSSRCGGQTYNRDTIDLNLLKAFFIEKKRDDVASICRLIDANRNENGWLIFVTHDVDEKPTPFGCTPAVFEQIVDYSLASGAMVLPVREALRYVGAY